jgi:hypothetical protein
MIEKYGRNTRKATGAGEQICPNSLIFQSSPHIGHKKLTKHLFTHLLSLLMLLSLPLTERETMIIIIII